MNYIKLKPGVWVKYEESAETGTILFKRKMQARKNKIEDELASIAPRPTDEELLAWARANYVVLDQSRREALLNAELAQLDTDLANMAAD